MKTTRFFLFSSLLCLPTIAAIAALLWFSIARVPKLTKYEPVRVGLAYREIAEKLKDKPGSATYVGERPKGWWQHGKIDGLPLDTDVYDLASWCAVSELTEKSARNRSQAMDIPDFTRGAWATTAPVGDMTIDVNKIRLDMDTVKKTGKQQTV